MGGITTGRLGSGEIVCKMDLSTLSLLAVQTAANILLQIPYMPVDSQSPEFGVPKIIKNEAHWSPHGFLKALQTQVEFLYEVIPSLVFEGHTLIYFGEARLIASALRAYQEYKTKVVKLGYENHGTGWGDASLFNRANWADRNEMLLSTFFKEG